MSIIEKLGIAPGQWTIEEHGNGEALYSGRNFEYHGYNLVYLTEPDWNWNTNKKVIEAAPEMLEALISVQRYIQGEPWDDIDISKVIEKATGRTWEEVKEIIDE